MQGLHVFVPHMPPLHRLISYASLLAHKAASPRCRQRLYPSLFVRCTSAPASTSASAVSVWPFDDARCSAVFLHSHETLPQDRPTAWTVPSLLVTQRLGHAHLAREAALQRTQR